MTNDTANMNLTGSSDAVESDKSVEASGGSRQESGHSVGKESARPIGVLLSPIGRRCRVPVDASPERRES